MPANTETSPPRARTFNATVLAVFALGALLRTPTFGRVLLSDDEAIYATTADALGRGDRLYREVVDHKPPLVYHVYQAGFALCGRYQTHAAHALRRRRCFGARGSGRGRVVPGVFDHVARLRRAGGEL